MKDLISEFNAYLLNVKKSSSNTVESYIRDINRYSEYLKTSDRDILNADTDFKFMWKFYISPPNVILFMYFLCK